MPKPRTILHPYLHCQGVDSLISIFRRSHCVTKRSCDLTKVTKLVSVGTRERTPNLIPEPMPLITRRPDSLVVPVGFSQYREHPKDSASPFAYPRTHTELGVPPTTKHSPVTADRGSNEGPGEGTNRILRQAFHFNSEQQTTIPP